MGTVGIKKVVRAASVSPVVATRWYVRRVHAIRPTLARQMNDTFNSDHDDDVTDVLYKPKVQAPVHLTFATPNAVCKYRAETFSYKEPETLDWIEEFGGEGAFYDIGSNIGIYAVYHAKLFTGRVYAFEPSVLNLKWLARNLTLNAVLDRVVVVPIPLSSSNGVASFRLSSLEEGGALSAFGVDFGHDGEPHATQMQYEMLGFSLDFLVSSGAIPDPPSIIKLDVDGIEHLILSGSKSVLTHPSLRSVLVEVDESFALLAREVSRMLSEAGFRLREKRHGVLFDIGEFANTYNQIWVRE